MDRRRFLLTFLVAALTAPVVAEAQQPRKLYRVGYLLPQSDPGAGRATPTSQAYWRELETFGFVVGENVIEHRLYAAGQLGRFPTLATELVRRNVEVIVAATTVAVQAARQTTHTIPIVMVNVGDPVGDGLIASLAQPGGNVTGVAQPFFELNAKLLQLLRELLPKARRLAMVIQPESPTVRRFSSDLQQKAGPMGIEVDVFEARDGNELERHAQTMKTSRTDVVWFFTSVFRAGDPAVTNFALRHRIPTVHESRLAVESGGLMSYGESDLVRWRRVARYVARILQGAHPRDLPVEQSTYLELTLNLKTARALGLTIPPSVLLRADQVIE